MKISATQLSDIVALWRCADRQAASLRRQLMGEVIEQLRGLTAQLERDQRQEAE